MKMHYQSKNGPKCCLFVGLSSEYGLFCCIINHLYNFGALRCTGLARRFHPDLYWFVKIGCARKFPGVKDERGRWESDAKDDREQDDDV